MKGGTRHPAANLAIMIERGWADQGKLIEGGLQAYLVLTGLTNAPESQKQELRKAWMFGSQHLFASIVGTLSPGADPTPADLKRFELIAKELEAFDREVNRGMPPPVGPKGDPPRES